MVGELVVRARDLEARHVAGRTVRLGLGASLLCAACGGVAGGAFSVVCGKIFFERSVNVMTAGAADAAVFGVVTLGVGETVGLKADIINAARTVGGNVGPGTMAASASIALLFGGPLGELGHRGGFQVAALDRFEMCAGICVATLATYSWLDRIEIDETSFDGIGGVAGEAGGDVFGRHLPTGRL